MYFNQRQEKAKREKLERYVKEKIKRKGRTERWYGNKEMLMYTEREEKRKARREKAK